MITSVNKNNASDYRKLFAKASKTLGFTYDEAAVNAMTDEEFQAWWDAQRVGSQSSKLITSLDEYFQNIVDLVTDGGLTYTVLPLDEPAFEINANTRFITVPDEFKANGISVKGEEGAEIVYFSIDRYFDATDLGAEDTNIVIQWESADGTEFGASPAIIRDIESHPGKLIFGWYLDDTITASAGTIKFGVRIYKLGGTNGDVITFNFSTLTASATIQQGLDYDLNEVTAEMVDGEEIIRGRLINSPATSNTTPAATPVYIINLVDSINTDQLVELDADANYWFYNGQAAEDGVLYTSTKAGATNERGKKLLVNANVSDEGVLAYSWYKYNLSDMVNGTLSGTGVLQTSAFQKYEVTTDSLFVANKAYYLGYTVSGTMKYELISTASYSTGDPIDTWLDIIRDEAGKETAEVYNLNSIYIAGSTGYYKAVAVNHLGKNKAEQASNISKIPGPGSLAISANIQHDGKNNLANGAHAFFKHTVVEDVDTISEANPEVLATTDALNNVSYSWSKKVGSTVTNLADITKVISVEAPTAANDLALFDEEYTVSVNAERNKDVTANQTLKIRVTDYAHKFANKKTVNTNGEFTDLLVSGEEINLDDFIDYDSAIHDNVTYQWVSVIGTQVGDNEVEISGANAQSYTPSSGCMISCKVTNQILDSDRTTVLSEAVWYTPIFNVRTAG